MNLKISLLFIFFLGVVSHSIGQSIKTSGSSVVFKAPNMWLNSVKGEIKGLKGRIVFDSADLEKANFNVCIDPTTINTGNEKRDAHLNAEEYFHTEKYPAICITSNSIEKVSEGYLLKGKLTMKGIRKDISIPFTFENSVFKGTLEIDRLAFNIGPDGGFMIGKKIEVEVTCAVE